MFDDDGDDDDYGVMLLMLCCQAGIALTLCQQLATSMGPAIKQYVRVLGPGIVSNFGDSKVSINC